MIDLPARSRRDAMLVTSAWLQAHLDDPEVRIIDCSAQLIVQPVGASKVESGLPAWREAHIPGARYLNMATDLSDPEGRYPYTFPSDARIAALMGALGVGNRHHVVLYGHGYLGSVTRAWYVLHTAGHERLSLLDGGFERWRHEDRPVTASEPSIVPEVYTVRRQARRIVNADEVLAGLASPAVCRINALSREQFAGSGGTHYGRPGRIPDSVSAPARDVIDAANGCFLPDESLRAQLRAAGALEASRAITYCGGGIAASVTAFVLEMLGHPDWGLYDNSLLEWSTRPDLPMQTGAAVARR
jgi:thiosulfate/3-mercaptopyruvate sulfurtransferase